MEIEIDASARANGRASVDDVPEFDTTKLWGFRSLLPVTKRESDIRKSSNLAFNKAAPRD